jgi:peptide/nickel transport system permease protein
VLKYFIKLVGHQNQEYFYMVWFILKRLMRAVITVFFVSFVIFVLIRVVPGDPVRQIVSGIASDAAVEKVRKELGLDKPIIVQYMIFLNKAVKGDLGESFFRSAGGQLSGSIQGSSDMLLKAASQDASGLEMVEGGRAKKAQVTDLIFKRFPLTLSIIFSALILGLIISYLLAIIGVNFKKAGSIIEIITVFIAAIPNFWLAIMFLLVFAAKLKLLPGVGYSGLKSLILPSIVLAITLIPAAFKTMFENLKRINKEPFMIEF